MFGLKKKSTPKKWAGKPARTRRRDGHQFLSGSERRRIRKAAGISARCDRNLTKERRAYRKGHGYWNNINRNRR